MMYFDITVQSEFAEFMDNHDYWSKAAVDGMYLFF